MNFCSTGKQSYLTATAAWRVIHFLTSKAALHTHKQTGKGGGHAYRCQECGQWHMTSRRNRTANRPRRHEMLIEWEARRI